MLSLFQNIKAILAKYFMIFTAVLVVIFVLIGGIFLTFSILRIKDISNNAQKVISNHMRTQTLHNIEWGVNEKKELLETLTAAIEATVGNTTRTTIENLNLAFKSIDISNRNKFNIGIASSNPKREGVWIYGGDFLKTDQNAHFSKYHGLAINEKYMGAIIPNGQGAPYYKKLSRTLYDPFIRIYNLYSGILWVYCGIEKDGGLIGVPLGDTHPRGYDARARNWYKIASNEEDFTWTLPYVESSEQNVVLAGVMPLRNDDKKLLGVLAVDLSLSDAMQLSDLSSLYKGISVLVVDGDGKVVIHDDYDSDEPSMKESVPIIDLDELPLSRSAMEQIENSKVGVIRSDDDQNPGFVVISSPVRNLDWKILAIVPDKILMSDSQAMVSHVMRIMKNVTYSLMLYYLLSLVVSIVVLIFISKRRTLEVGKRLERDMQPLKLLAEKLELYHEGERIFLDTDAKENLCREFSVLYDAIGSFTNKIEEATKREADEKVAVALGKIAANVAHDIRSPLSVLKTYLELGDLEGLSPEEIIEIRDASRRSIKKLEVMADEMISYSKARELDRQRCNMAEILNGAMDSVRIKAKRAKVNLDISDEEIWVAIDHDKMIRVFVNLINNAIEACERGGNVSVDVNEKDDLIQVEVKDDGRGIADGDLNNIFNSLFTSGKKGGTGLGLTYCKEVVESHNGSVEVVSEVGSGSTFTVKLPKK